MCPLATLAFLRLPGRGSMTNGKTVRTTTSVLWNSDEERNPWGVTRRIGSRSVPRSVDTVVSPS